MTNSVIFKIKWILCWFFVLVGSDLTAQTEKETIRNVEAAKLYQEHSKYLESGNVDFAKALSMLNRADSLEPNNPIILHERGLTKFNYLHDAWGGMIDIDRSIQVSKDPKRLEARYNNRGLCYMELGDIDAACKDFHAAGNFGKMYVEEYCQGSFEYVPRNNPDTNLVLELKIKEPQTRIISTHNSPQMSSCYGTITIRNLGLPTIKVANTNFDYGIETGESTIYLEAIDSTGRKFRFHTNSTYATFSKNKDLQIKKGLVYEFEEDLTSQHQFPYPGMYKVRVAIRPSDNTSGLKDIYYSNWVDIQVIYAPEERESFGEGF